MCIAVPRQVLQVRAGEAEVANEGTSTWVSLQLLSEAVAVGDYVVLQGQRYAVARMDATEARIRLDLFAELGLVSKEEGADA